jgi:hypothetical protein
VEGACVVVRGLRIGIRVNGAGVLDEIEGRLPPGWKPSQERRVDRLFSIFLGGRDARVKRFNLVYAGIVRRARTHDREEALLALEAELRQAVAAGSRRAVFVHAGVVGWRGRAILVPGRSGAGKTTLVAELVRAGATYYSDEFAVLQPSGRVEAFAKPLSVRQPDGRTQSTPVEALGGQAGRTPLRPALVALATHRPGSRWRPARLSKGQALLALLAHTVPVRRRPRASLAALEAVLEGALVQRGPRGEARDAAAALLRTVDRIVDAEGQPERGAA